MPSKAESKPEPAPEPQPTEADEWRATAIELNREIRRAESEWLGLKERTKEAKECLESCQAKLSSFIGSLDQEMPLFDQKPPPRGDLSTPLEDVPGIDGEFAGAMIEDSIDTCGQLAETFCINSDEYLARTYGFEIETVAAARKALGVFCETGPSQPAPEPDPEPPAEKAKGRKRKPQPA